MNIVVLESIGTCVILMCYKKNGKELPEDGVDKRRNVSELQIKSD